MFGVAETKDATPRRCSTVASRRMILLEAGATASHRATHSTAGGRIVVTYTPAPRERADNRHAVVNRRVSAVTTVRTRIALVAVHSATANHDCEDAAEDAANLAATRTAVPTASTCRRCDRLRTGTWKRCRLDRSWRDFNRLRLDFGAHIRLLNFNWGRNALRCGAMLHDTLRRSNLARRGRRGPLDCGNDLRPGRLVRICEINCIRRRCRIEIFLELVAHHRVSAAACSDNQHARHAYQAD